MRAAAKSHPATQLKLFHPASRRPSWEQLPTEIRQHTVRLLAQLLREHWLRAVKTEREARDE
jgi:hypothetical protein